MKEKFMDGLFMLLIMMSILNKKEEGIENFNPYSKDLKDEEIEKYVKENLKKIGDFKEKDIKELIRSIKEMRERIGV